MGERAKSEVELVQSWRLEVLLQVGYGRYDAELLAKRLDIDLHLACDLLEQGCSPEQAIAILL